MTVTDRDAGYRRIVRQLQAMPSLQVVVGIREDKGSYPPDEDGETATVAEIASINEFGRGNVPERSFMRSTFDENVSVYDGILKREIRAVADERLTLRRALGRLGLRVAADVQKRIVDLDTPPNAAQTIAQKGSSNPLIDTGRMRQSVDHEIRGFVDAPPEVP